MNDLIVFLNVGQHSTIISTTNHIILNVKTCRGWVCALLTFFMA